MSRYYELVKGIEPEISGVTVEETGDKIDPNARVIGPGA